MLWEPDNFKKHFEELDRYHIKVMKEKTKTRMTMLTEEGEGRSEMKKTRQTMKMNGRWKCLSARGLPAQPGLVCGEIEKGLQYLISARKHQKKGDLRTLFIIESKRGKGMYCTHT